MLPIMKSVNETKTDFHSFMCSVFPRATLEILFNQIS